MAGVWLRDASEGWLDAELLSETATHATIRIRGETKIVPKSEIELQGPDSKQLLEDMTAFSTLGEGTLYHNVTQRFLEDNIYVSFAFVFLVAALRAAR